MKPYYLLSLLWVGLLAACTSQPVQQQPNSHAEYSAKAIQTESSSNLIDASQQLGTKWGDDVSSYVQHVNLKRGANQPVDETQVRYADQQFSGRRINSISLASGKISFSILDDHGRTLALYREGPRYFLSGQNGQSYQLHYNNSSAQTFEIVASVDGLDVLDGRQASRKKSGYVLRPYSSISIEGFRKSNRAVASFTFSAPQQSYAANSTYGSIQNTGIIGTVVYELKVPKAERSVQNDGYAPAPNAFPAD